MKIQVRVGPSRIAGQGLFAAQDIPKGTRIMQYIGEKISSRERARRLAAGNAYIFHLTYRYAIDGQTLDNTARYINHSCDPNCEAEKTSDTVWIIALREITAGEELSYNYGYDASNLWRPELLWVYPGSGVLGSDLTRRTCPMNDQPVVGRDAPCPRSPQRSRHHARAVERRMRANGSLSLCDTHASQEVARCLGSYHSST